MADLLGDMLPGSHTIQVADEPGSHDFVVRSGSRSDRAVRDVLDHLTSGEVDRTARKALGDALDQANNVPEPKSFPARALRYGMP